MKRSEIVKVDARGRIVIPRPMRQLLGIKKDSHIMIVSDEENPTELRIVPLLYSEEQSFLKIRIIIPDEAGSLAKIAQVFGELGISLLHGQTTVLKKGVDAEWEVISPVPETPMEELENVLKEKGGAKRVIFETTSF